MPPRQTTRAPNSALNAGVQGFIAGLTQQNVGAVIQRQAEIDESRRQQEKHEENVQQFQLNMGNDPEGQKLFKEMSKRDAAWGRDPESFRQFSANYSGTLATNAAIDEAVAAGVLPNNPGVIKSYKNMALNDYEGTTRALTQQVMASHAQQQKAQLEAQGAEQKAKLADIQMSNATNQQAEIDRKIKARDAGVTHAVTQMVKDLGESPTDAGMSDFMADNPDLFKNLSTDIGELKLGIANQKNLRVREDNRKQQARIRSEDFMSKAKEVGFSTSGFSKTAFANNVMQFDPAKIKKEKVYEGDPNVVSEGFVGDPTTGLPLIYSEMSDGTFGVTSKGMNTPAIFYQMERDAQGNLVTKKGPDGNPVEIPSEARVLQARKYIEDATKETNFFGQKQSPIGFVNGLNEKLIADVKKRDDAFIDQDQFFLARDTGRTTGRSRSKVFERVLVPEGTEGAKKGESKKVINTNSDAGLLLDLLKSLEASMKETSGLGVRKRSRVKKFKEEIDESTAAAQAYVNYKALRAKAMALEAGVFE